MAEPERDDIGARIRAATAYAQLDEKAAAQVMKFSIRTLARVEAGERDLSIPEAKALCAATGVPMRFLLDGWEIYEEMEKRVARLDEVVARLTQRLAAGAAPPPPGALGHELRGDAPTSQDPGRTENQEEEDSQREGDG